MWCQKSLSRKGELYKNTDINNFFFSSSCISSCSCFLGFFCCYFLSLPASAYPDRGCHFTTESFCSAPDSPSHFPSRSLPPSVSVNPECIDLLRAFFHYMPLLVLQPLMGCYCFTFFTLGLFWLHHFVDLPPTVFLCIGFLLPRSFIYSSAGCRFPSRPSVSHSLILSDFISLTHETAFAFGPIHLLYKPWLRCSSRCRALTKLEHT